jgi:hypothetical protein
MRVLLALALVGLGIAFLFWGPWKPRDPADIEPPPARPAPTGAIRNTSSSQQLVPRGGQSLRARLLPRTKNAPERRGRSGAWVNIR